MSPNPNPNPNNPNLNPNAPAGAGGGAPSPPPDEPRDPRWFWLTVSQYALIATVTITFVWVLSSGITNVKDLADLDIARGLITFVITVATVAIAMMLALTAIVTRDFDKRIAVGKEVLTILVGVLGTIVGFYYGAATTKKDTGQSGASAPAAQISFAQVEPKQLQSDGTATLSTKLTGGTPPYRYSIRFMPDTIPAIENQESANGDISHAFKAAVPAGTTDVVIRIEGKDKNDVAFAYNKDGKQKIPVR